MSKHTLEIVEFKLNDGVTVEDFLQEVEKSNSFVSSLKGFIKRHIAQDEHGLWVDVVEWQGRPSAMDAAKHFEQASEVKNFMMKINHATIRMRYFEIEDTM